MSSEYERKVIILGKTGNGKSSLGNNLLGRPAFDQARGFIAVTTECQLKRKNGRVSVVDTPGLFDSDGERRLLQQALDVRRAIEICPNPHAFLIVLNGFSPLTQEELISVDIFQIIFGVQCLEKAIIVLTHIENDISDEELQEMLEESVEMRRLINRCGDRFARIDNTDPNPEHRNHIIRLVDQVSKAGNESFGNEYIHVDVDALQEALKPYDNRQVQINEEREKRNRKNKKIATSVAMVALGVGFLAFVFGGGDAKTEKCAEKATERVVTAATEKVVTAATEKVVSVATNAVNIAP